MGFFGGGGGTTPVNMVGASSGTAGTAGYVPAPAAGNQNLFLRGDATFKPLQPPSNPPVSTITHGAGAVNSSSVAFWVYPWMNGGSTGNSGLTCWFCPIYIPKQDTYNRIGCQVQAGAAGSTIGLALYDNDETNYLPKNLIASSSSGISSASPGTIEQSFSALLSEGWYHGCVLASTTTTLTFRIESSYWQSFYGSITPWGGAARNQALGVRLTNARSSVTDFPTTISSSDVTYGVTPVFALIGIRKV